MKLISRVLLFLFLLQFLVGGIVSAHPGRTDKKGCHVCKTNCKKRGLKQGQYHCHNKK